jgi:hypothetical protein
MNKENEFTELVKGVESRGMKMNLLKHMKAKFGSDGQRELKILKS